MRSAAPAGGCMPRGKVIRAEKGAWRREPYLMEQPGGRLRHARKKGNRSQNAAAALLTPR